jgi:hypothetical protein
MNRHLNVLMAMYAVTMAVCTAAPAADWQQLERRCFADYARKWQQTHGTPCVSCSGGWQDIARCTAAKLPALDSPERCIAGVAAAQQNAPMSTDRVALVMSCLAAGN